jgi:hypothetical protein
MMSLFTYEDAKRLNEEKVRRSLARYELAQAKKEAKARDQAEIVEIAFGARCDHEESISA